MASDLYEILESYGARDVIMVEAPAAVDLQGINAACLWTRSLAEVFAREHGLDGNHATLKVPRACLRLRAGGAPDAGSWFDGKRPAAAGVSVAWGGMALTVSWTQTLPTYAAAAFLHDWGNLDPVLGSVSSLTPTSCMVDYASVPPALVQSDLTLLLWW